MNRAETIMILSCLRVAFPNAYKGVDLEATVNLWSRLFADDDYKVVSKAVDKLISTREAGWTPSIGEVKSEIAKLMPNDYPSAEEEWLLVNRATKRGSYYAEKEFNKLPPIVQEVVGHYSQIKEWAMMSEDEVRDVVSNRFKKAYKAKLEEGVRESKLPNELKDAVTLAAAQIVADKLRLKS